MMLLMLTGIVQGAEATTSASDAGSAIPTWVTWVVEGVYAALGFVATYFFGWLAKNHANTQAKNDAVEALRVGVTTTYQTLYKEWKSDSEDGKLTEDEKRRLRENAIKVAKDVATGPGLKVLQAYGTDVLHSLVERIVSSQKNAATPEVK